MLIASLFGRMFAQTPSDELAAFLSLTDEEIIAAATPAPVDPGALRKIAAEEIARRQMVGEDGARYRFRCAQCRGVFWGGGPGRGLCISCEMSE